MTEGFLRFHGYKTWYASYGDPHSATPVVLLHGGPGFPHYHLQNLTTLANQGIPVIIYDQLGCGKSDRPDNPKLWTVQLFIDELEALRAHLKLEKLHLLGHSWGGSLAAEYALAYPDRVDKLILSSPLIDSQLWIKEADRLKDELPVWARDAMRRHEAASTTHSDEYRDAYIEYSNRFICRIRPHPRLIMQADNEAGDQVYNVMWGPSESHVTGVLKDWTLIGRAKNIHAPTLFISGKYDEATPAQIEPAHQEITGSKWVILENSSHTGNFEEPENYIRAAASFLTDTP